MQKLSDKELLEELEKRFLENTKSVQELKDLAEQLKKVNAKLEESETLKSHFLSNIRNEIINPFASIMALSKSIISLKSEGMEKARYMAGLIHSEAFILDFQLNNIFTAAEVEAGMNFPQITNVQILVLVKNAIESFNPLALQKNISINLVNQIASEAEDDYFFKTDPYKLQLVVSNLLSNSVLYSNEYTNIEVNVSACGENLCISVKDEGVGIDEEFQKDIFDRFKRLNSKICTPSSGQGLGLSVVKEMLDMLNGTIQIKSTKGVGSTFFISIPEADTDIDIDGFSSGGNEEIF